ncbi:unnamed protein product [Aspergillus oryzae]|nr:unnamed protein product [Aspergillus oryzae]
MSTTTTEIQEIAEATHESFTIKDLVDFSGRTYGDWRDEFHRNGCVVLKNVISPERAKYYADKQIEWLKNFELGFDENDESTWTAEHLPKSVWEARTEPAIIEIFEKLWETKELLCSFDGINISLPRRKDLNWSPWPHCDQNPNRKGFGSAKLFDEFFAQKRDQYDHEDAPPPELKYMDLFLFHEKDVKWFEERGCELIKVNLEPGDFVLWDSRTMHYACFPEADQIRHAQYICMTPKRFATEKALELKKTCFENYLGTTHWPHW